MALIRTSDIVIAFVYQVIFLHQVVIWTSIVGAVVVLASVAATCVRKMHISRQERAKFEKNANINDPS